MQISKKNTCLHTASIYFVLLLNTIKMEETDDNLVLMTFGGNKFSTVHSVANRTPIDYSVTDKIRVLS